MFQTRDLDHRIDIANPAPDKGDSKGQGGTMLRTVKPRNARSKRALEARDPKVKEGAKTCIFIRGEKTSQRVNKALSELVSGCSVRVRVTAFVSRLTPRTLHSHS